MQTHMITYHDENNKTLGVRILYELTNEQALELFDVISKWAHTLFPSCCRMRIESVSSGDIIKTIAV